ncbi:MAG: twin-arginine translocase TatA/TatE family subunit [Flavobacteriales bacterium]|nr:twin-arginine translocase TatA/TatE family subunit [Flavobacteriales bacterium]MBK6754638.1 twin-arginine translocase TatA/TatE family subunit [Flavobacteriales bacterium]MBK7085869.1 twin-arginine translocase TatA/TatE family subunit [Flavobacteriales bacterium]MBK7268603.1 twin-arginine translocase TatA/TatE family subunit [Flavobacteriales bacterium]MBK7754340.1 twin-arginine translocase TatA/TatE family subunit [Flavobacteriales bacterium]
MRFVLIFDISGGELLVILMFALLFFGAKGIPDIARTAGRTMRQLRDATDDVQREIRKGAMEVKREVDAQKRVLSAEPPDGARPVVKPTAVPTPGETPTAPLPAEEPGTTQP